ncbi:unnamed protein product [Cuscuta epithymum]|uniref:Uncharacterized protein n=1 Tax=Cuscuta epithymum TaxID=186058 RepID=A0AAV0F689_9ASTE|nr:unnamed protein product [Cuscuta epithymum]
MVCPGNKSGERRGDQRVSAVHFGLHGEVSNEPEILINKQWSDYVDLINNCKVQSISENLTGMNFSTDWILDSGASFHMTGPICEDTDWSGQTTWGSVLFSQC